MRAISVLIVFACFANACVGQAVGDKKTEQGQSLAQEEVAEQKKTRMLWTDYYAAQLPKYKIYLAGDPDKKLTVDPQPKFRWKNPVRDASSTHGDVFVWTRNGRVDVVGTIFSYQIEGQRRRVAHGFHSMSAEAVTITRDGRRPFTIPAPGLVYEPVPNAPKVSTKQSIRMAQMRRISKSFTATVTENNETRQPLRALSEPIYRFESNDAGRDGAVFAYVFGTDPELILAIETRSTPTGPKWYFAAGRFTTHPLQLMYQKSVVWRYRPGENEVDGYVSQHGIDMQPLIPTIKS